MVIGVYNHLLSQVFRFHYHSQKVIGSLGNVYIYIHTFWIDHDPGKHETFRKAGALQARWDQMTAQMAMVQKRAEEVGDFFAGNRW